MELDAFVRLYIPRQENDQNSIFKVKLTSHNKPPVTISER